MTGWATHQRHLWYKMDKVMAIGKDTLDESVEDSRGKTEREEMSSEWV